ncbi:MAG: glycosyltransferase family 2 protein [Tannerellaceae bacterium]|nr:glycosyltransferase family 2 protein [Tannerellaceae bacterium]
MVTGISVLMPTYNQQTFIRRAFASLEKQTYEDWELIIINDGTSNLDEYIKDILQNPKVKYIENETNQGLGYSINQGLEKAKYDYIAYLPSDDFYYENHLLSMKEELEKSEDTVLVFSGVEYGSNNSLEYSGDTENILGKNEHALQLVQVCHKKTEDKWLERKEYVTEDLFLMYWNKLVSKGTFRATFQITCFWTIHYTQRHSIICEKFRGNINRYRSYYKIQNPIKIRAHKNKFVDEEKLYEKFRKKVIPAKKSLKILLLGELSYNPERAYALEEAGHQLYGFLLPNPPYAFHTVGKLPFGNIQDISFTSNWVEEIKNINPDIIYGISNMHGIDFIYNTIYTLKNNF